MCWYYKEILSKEQEQYSEMGLHHLFEPMRAKEKTVLLNFYTFCILVG